MGGLALVFLLLAGCEETEEKTGGGATGDTVCPCAGSCDDWRTVEFAGYTWRVRQGDRPMQAGANCYSAFPDDVWVDDQGRMHLMMRARGGVWVSTEVYAQAAFGYGTYEFYVANQIDALDKNVVVGLFTWDPNAPAGGTLSELDVEVTRWGREYGHNLHYSLQPLYGPDAEGRYDERTTSMFMVQNQSVSTHVIDWGPGAVYFASYQGRGNPTGDRIGQWTFSGNNPARRGDDTVLTTPFVIPTPSPSTQVRMNVWLKDTDGDGFGNPPSDGRAVEVIVDGFVFRPA